MPARAANNYLKKITKNLKQVLNFCRPRPAISLEDPALLRSCLSSSGWLAGLCFIAWQAGWLAGRLAGWLAGCFAGWFFGCLLGGCFGRCFALLLARLVGRSIDSLVAWWVGCVFRWLASRWPGRVQPPPNIFKKF